MPRKLTTKEFILRSSKIHNNKYDYSLVEYKNNKTKVKIICPQHGEFFQEPNFHLRGQGCRKCLSPKKQNTKKSIEKLILDFNKVHNYFYDYSLINETNYKNNKSKIPIICHHHGLFFQRPDMHLQGKKCKYCAHRSFSLSVNELIERIHVIYPQYDCSLIKNYKNNKTKVPIICPNHGIFYIKPNAILSKQGCPICKTSKGELIIFNFLTKYNIPFKPEYRFLKCRSILYNKTTLPFDFYLPEHNICIEFDGRQHFEIVNFGFSKRKRIDLIDNLNRLQMNDKIKNDFCLQNNIKLIRIPYWEIKSIENILTDYLFK